MRVLRAQVLMLGLLTGCGAHLLLGALDGHPDGGPNFYGRPSAPHPLEFPPQHYHHYIPRPPVFYRAPQQVIIVRGVFPPFIERVVQRIQTYWSVYNPTPPPLSDDNPATYRPPKKKVTTTTTIPPATTTKGTYTTEEEEAADTSAPPEDTTVKVSTLAVFEVTPSTAPEDPPEEPVPETSTTAVDLESDTEEPVFITPEKASLLGQKDAFLRFLQTGKVPPYLESDTLNGMDDIFS